MDTYSTEIRATSAITAHAVVEFGDVADNWDLHLDLAQDATGTRAEVVGINAPHYGTGPASDLPEDDEVQVQLWQPNGLSFEHLKIFVPLQPVTNAQYALYAGARKAGQLPEQAAQTAGI